MRRKMVATSVIAVSMVLIMTMSAFAVTNKSISLPENQKWVTASTLDRTGKYSYVSARCESVYPESGTDNFTKIQIRITNSSGTLIMNTAYTTLTEGASDYSTIAIKQGYVDVTKVRFQFRGNSSKKATAVVSYTAN